MASGPVPAWPSAHATRPGIGAGRVVRQGPLAGLPRVDRRRVPRLAADRPRHRGPIPSRVKSLFHSFTHARPNPSAEFSGVFLASNLPVAGSKANSSEVAFLTLSESKSGLNVLTVSPSASSL